MEQEIPQSSIPATATIMNAPKPAYSHIENGQGYAEFDWPELKRYLETTTDKGFVVQNEKGEAVGIAHVDPMKDFYLGRPIRFHA